MLKKFIRAAATPHVYDNTVDAYKPELWANSGLAILEANMVLGNLVYRDFSNVVASFGETVHTRKPGTFKMKRKTNADSVTIQDATATDIPVKLDQHVHASFMIKDGEESKSFQDLLKIYLQPAVLCLAEGVDQILSGQAIRFMANAAGGLNTLTSVNAAQYIIEARQVMNINKAAQDSNRHLILGTISESVMLQNSQFTDANRIGDDGTALREASLGRKFGWNIFMAQNEPYVAVGNTKVTGAINLSAGYVAGTKTFTVDGLSAAITAGTWLTIAGDDTPLQVVSTTGGSTPTVIVTYTGTKKAVVNDAVITLYTPGAVNNVSGYAAGYAKEITVDTFSVAPQVGQPVTFGSDNANIYTVIDVNALVGITLDRPLVAAIVNDAAVNIGPAGSYNFGFHQNAIALVSRPLALPRPGTGAVGAVINFNNLAMRVVMTYNGEKQGTLVTADMLLGVAVLEPLEGVVLYG